MEILTGRAVAPGVAVAEAVVLVAEDFRIPYRTVPPEKVSDEQALLDRAVQAAVRELEEQTEAWLLGPAGTPPRCSAGTSAC